MMERGILFSGPMVKALLAGTKTQTRRIVKGIDQDCDGIVRRGSKWQMLWNKSKNPDKALLELCDLSCPHGKPGDLLWVRETWNYTRDLTVAEQELQSRILADFHAGTTGDIVSAALSLPNGSGEKRPLYAADFGDWAYNVDSDLHWKPSIHMPKWAARIWLEITDVRVERVQEISGRAAAAEGFRLPPYDPSQPDATFGITEKSMIDSFARTWRNLNDERPGWGWDENPWVWVISFRRIEKPAEKAA